MYFTSPLHCTPCTMLVETYIRKNSTRQTTLFFTHHFSHTIYIYNVHVYTCIHVHVSVLMWLICRNIMLVLCRSIVHVHVHVCVYTSKAEHSPNARCRHSSLSGPGIQLHEHTYILNHSDIHVRSQPPPTLPPPLRSVL